MNVPAQEIQERRRFERNPARFEVFSRDTGEPIGRTVNLSVGGMMVRIEGSLYPYIKLLLKFRLPGERKPLQALCDVRWVRRRKRSGAAASVVGIKFVELSKRVRKKIQEYIRSFYNGIRIKEPLLKRPFDLICSTLIAAALAPLWVVVAIAIKMEDGGPVFYKQKRWGKDKKKIGVYKFRTMVPDSDRKWGNVQASKDDPRVTRVGRFLRATALDEMPQLLNVIRGEMSLVGPRTLPINEIQTNEDGRYLGDEDVPGFELRCKVRPGGTGIAQIYAPRDIDRRNKFRYDQIYIKNQSLWLDIKLIALSACITLKCRWETRGEKV